MSALEDYEVEDQEFIALDEGYAEIDRLGEEIKQLGTAAFAVESFGINPTAMLVMDATGLLSSTALSSLALETYSSGDTESKMALEALLDKFKEKMTAWSAKIVSLFSEGGAKVLSTVKGLWDKLKISTEAVNKKVFASADKAKHYVRAHPYKTLAAAAAAAVAVTGIVAFAVRGLPSYSNAKELPRFMGKLADMIKKIRWPFGPVVPKLSNGGKKITVAVAGVATAAGVATIANLGWTRSSTDNLAHQFGKVHDEMDLSWDNIQEKSLNALKHGWTVTKGIYHGISGGFDTGYNAGVEPAHDRMTNAETGKHMATGVMGMTLGVFAVGVVSIAYVLYHLVKAIVCGSLRLINMTMNALQKSAPANEKYI